jgi:hypothetical protein
MADALEMATQDIPHHGRRTGNGYARYPTSWPTHWKWLREISHIMADALEMVTRDFKCVAFGPALFGDLMYDLRVIVGGCKAGGRKERSSRNLF